MTWTVTASQDEESWLDDYVASVLDMPTVPLPPAISKLGATTIRWFSPNPGDALVFTDGGSAEDRSFAWYVTAHTLRSHGYEVQSFTIDAGLTKEASWLDIMAKAKRLIKSGNVQLLRNGYTYVVAHVIGDHGEYNSEFSREDPGSRSITQWECECPWPQYAWQRTRKWKKYEGRPCAHVLGTYWKSLGTPLDEDRSPGPGGPPMAPGGQGGQPPGAQTPAQPPVGPSAPPGGPATPQGEQMSLFAPDAGIIPQVQEPLPPYQPGSTPPGQPAPPNAVSAPGAILPTPGNPVQYPGGTFSHVAAKGDTFANGMRVRLDRDEYGEAMGPSTQHGAGGYLLVKAGQPGEVLGQDQITGWVDCIFDGPCKGNGPLEPSHVRCFIPPEYLTPESGSTPFIQRRR